MIKISNSKCSLSYMYIYTGMFEAFMCINLIGYTRDDVDVIELHDCFSTNELITYEALGLCPEGEY